MASYSWNLRLESLIRTQHSPKSYNGEVSPTLESYIRMTTQKLNGSENITLDHLYRTLNLFRNLMLEYL